MSQVSILYNYLENPEHVHFWIKYPRLQAYVLNFLDQIEARQGATHHFERTLNKLLTTVEDALQLC